MGSEKVIKEIKDGIAFAESRGFGGLANTMRDTLALLKEQEAEIRQLRLALDIAKGTCKGIKCGQFADMPTMQSAT